MWIGLLAIFIVGIIGGTSPILLKLVVRELPPLFITAARFLIAAVVLLPFFLKINEKKNVIKDIKNLVIPSLFFAFNVGLFSLAIEHTTAIISQILYLGVPIIVIVLSYYLLSESITRYKVIGLILAFCGTLFLIRQSILAQNSLAFGTPFGNILTLCASFAWAVYLVLSKKLTKKYSPVTTSFAGYVIAFLLLAMLVPLEYVVRPVDFEKVTLVGVISLFVLSFVNTAFFFFLYQFAIKKTTSFTASFSAYIGPFTAAVFAIPLFGEKITLELIIGGILIMIGVFFATAYGELKK